MSNKALASYANTNDNITLERVTSEMDAIVNGFNIRCWGNGEVKEIHGVSPSWNQWSEATVTSFGKLSGNINNEQYECSRCPRPFAVGDKVYTKVFIQTNKYTSFVGNEDKAKRVRETCCATCAERSGFIKGGE